MLSIFTVIAMANPNKPTDSNPSQYPENVASPVEKGQLLRKFEHCYEGSEKCIAKYVHALLQS